MNDLFETKDLGLAAALATLGHTCLGVRKEKHIGYFQFDPNVEMSAQEYFAGRLFGNLNAMMTNIKNLKSLVNNTK
ncbi:MAG: hypothetical protein IFNCLDLE_02700 [Ignavibacteriaceae bacterium]|nr:hypothetical protein [Ignavibacteriaceae bacterium]